jgi:capsular exopolysaccharide synthesis family protein
MDPIPDVPGQGRYHATIMPDAEPQPVPAPGGAHPRTSPPLTDLRKQLRVVRRWLPFLLAACVLSGLGIWFMRKDAPERFSATATLLVGEPDSGYSALQAGELAAYYAQLATTPDVLSPAAVGILDEELSVLQSRVEATSQAESPKLSITVTDTDPVRAAAFANAIAAEVIARSPAALADPQDSAYLTQGLQVLRDEIAAVQTGIAALLAKEQTDRLTAAELSQLDTLRVRQDQLWSTWSTLAGIQNESSTDRLSLTGPAQAPEDPSSPPAWFFAILAAFAGLLVAAAIAFMLEYLNDRVADPEAVTALTGLTTLGTIVEPRGDPKRLGGARLVTLNNARSPQAEAYRTLRANIEFRGPIKSLLVVGATSAAGNAAVAANLAITFAQAGRRVHLVDANLRRPGVHMVFGFPEEPGLTNLLQTTDLEIDQVSHDGRIGRLQVLTAGPRPPNPADWLALPQMRTLLDRIEASSDIVIIDGPAVDTFADALVLSAIVDATILTIDQSTGRSGAVLGASTALAEAHGNLIGAVLVRRVRAPADVAPTPRQNPAADGEWVSGQPTGRTPPA